MNIFISRKNPNIDEEIHLLENRLEEIFQPVIPRAEFIDDLRHRLQTREIVVSPGTLPKKVSSGLLVAGGILGSVLMIITGIRGVISMVSVVRLVIEYFNRDTQKQQATPA